MDRAKREIILNALERYHQRCTYTAMAQAVKGNRWKLMSDLPRNERNSFIVRSPKCPGGGKPTNYPPLSMHPHLCDNPEIIQTKIDLLHWLENKGIKL